MGSVGPFNLNCDGTTHGFLENCVNTGSSKNHSSAKDVLLGVGESASRAGSLCPHDWIGLLVKAEYRIVGTREIALCTI